MKLGMKLLIYEIKNFSRCSINNNGTKACLIQEKFLSLLGNSNNQKTILWEQKNGELSKTFLII